MHSTHFDSQVNLEVQQLHTTIHYPSLNGKQMEGISMFFLSLYMWQCAYVGIEVGCVPIAKANLMFLKRIKRVSQ